MRHFVREWPLLWMSTMPKRSMILRTIALGGCVSLYASGAYAQSAPPATAQPPAAPPQVMIIVEQPQAAVVVAPPPAVVEGRLAPKKEEEEWYGYQTLIVDAASLGLMIGGAAMAARSNGSGDAGGTVALTGAVGYVLGAPVVHWMHGRIGPGFGSLGLRVGLPLTCMFWGAVIGAASGSRDDDAVGAGAALGFVGGMAGAIILDAALLAYEKPSEKEKEAYESAQAKHPVRWIPTLAPQKEGATVGISGMFF
jgi:hypothetical protein